MNRSTAGQFFQVGERNLQRGTGGNRPKAVVAIDRNPWFDRPVKPSIAVAHNLKTWYKKCLEPYFGLVPQAGIS